MKDYIIGGIAGYFAGPSIVASVTFGKLMKKLTEASGIEDSNVVVGGAGLALYVALPSGQARNLGIGFCAGTLCATF